jgi:hypothetical protein
MKQPQPTKNTIHVFRHLCNLIPGHLVSKLSRELGLENRARSFSIWSHVVCMIYGQLTHALSLNDLCDSLRLHAGKLLSVRGTTPPSRNNLSHANKHRDATLAQKLFWAMMDHLGQL